jgi:predicted trehalose synthase
VKKERLLAEANFQHTPQGFGAITWRGNRGQECLLLSVHQYLADAPDGWTWCVARAMDNDSSDWVLKIAAVVATMHGAFADFEVAHGDLHVGQFLQHDDDYFVIDFDGDPLGGEGQSWMSDLVSMLCSFIHVAAVAEVKYLSAHDLGSWVEAVSEQFLGEYLRIRSDVRLPDRAVLLKKMADNERREHEYATRYLPEWTYAAEYGMAFVERRRVESA